MTNNNCEIILAYFMVFNLSFVGRRPLHPAREPSLYTPDDDVAHDFQLKETPCDEEMT
jgi:hypothetical protein